MDPFELECLGIYHPDIPEVVAIPVPVREVLPMGTADAHYLELPVTIDIHDFEILQPLYFIRDFLDIAADPDLDQEQKDQVLGNLKSETGRVIDKIRDHFDMKDE